MYIFISHKENYHQYLLRNHHKPGIQLTFIFLDSDSSPSCMTENRPHAHMANTQIASNVKFQFGSTSAGFNGCLPTRALFFSYEIHTFKKLTELKCAHKELNQFTFLHKNQPLREGRKIRFSYCWTVQYCLLVIQKSWLNLPYENKSQSIKK